MRKWTMKFLTFPYEFYFILLGIFGAIAKLVRQKKPPSIWQLISASVIGGFSALMSKAALAALGYTIEKNPDLVVFFCGLSGYAGPIILDIFVSYLEKFFKIRL